MCANKSSWKTACQSFWLCTAQPKKKGHNTVCGQRGQHQIRTFNAHVKNQWIPAGYKGKQRIILSNYAHAQAELCYRSSRTCNSYLCLDICLTELNTFVRLSDNFCDYLFIFFCTPSSFWKGSTHKSNDLLLGIFFSFIVDIFFRREPFWQSWLYWKCIYIEIIQCLASENSHATFIAQYISSENPKHQTTAFYSKCAQADKATSVFLVWLCSGHVSLQSNNLIIHGDFDEFVIIQGDFRQ